MGLDMNLTAKNYISEYAEEGKRLSSAISDIIPETTGFHIKSVTLSVAYWRKANAIHSWFVTNCQGGKDECRETHVERQALEELLALVKEVLANPKRAPELLPTRAGFFLGDTEYGDYYFEYLKHTEVQIETFLSNEKLKEWDIYYRAGW